MTQSVPASSTRPSPGYLYALSAACAGLPFLGIGLGGTLIGRAGGDPLRAMDVDGMVMFVLAFAVQFVIRLVFWPRAPAGLRAVVRLLISVLFAVCIPLAVVGLALALQLQASVPNRTIPIAFSVFAVLCQPGAVLWLWRYRLEGL